MSGIALCYVRKSSVRTLADEISPARQREAISKEAARRGWSAEVYADAEGHRSGRNENRPGWIELKARLDDPLIKGVIVESLSRASRSIRDLFVFVGELEKRHIALISLKESIDTTTAMGRAFLGVIAVLNQFESDVASERMKMTVAFKRDTLHQHWGYVPFGCVRSGNEQMLAPTNEGIWRFAHTAIAGRKDAPPFVNGAPVKWFGYLDAVDLCYNLYATNNLGFIELAARLNEHGFLYRDRKGVPRPFHTDDVRRMIEHADFYAGHLPQRHKTHAPGTTTRDTHPPILPRELCEQVIAVHQLRRGRWATGGGSPKRIYLLPQLYCAECGAHLKGQYSHGWRYYRHSEQNATSCTQSNYIRADHLENIVLDYLGCFRATDKIKERIRDKARRLAKQSLNPEIESARRRIKESASKLERLKVLFVDGEIDRAEYHRRKAKIEEQLHAASQIAQAAPADVKTLEDLLPKVDQIALVIRAGEPIHQRAVLTALFERIEILDRTMTKAIPRDWARPFFNGDSKHS